MNRTNVVLLILIVILVYFGCLQGIFAFQSGSLSTQSPTTIPTLSPTPRMPAPSYFYIPKIQVNAEIIPVGTDKNGTMELPEIWDKVGWYSPGFRPGEQGNVVLAGHLDSTTGAGAIFYNIRLLEPGDDMYVSDVEGHLYTYIVTGKEIYEYDKVPIAQVFGTSHKKLLNLITCTGTWDPIAHNYSHRIVVTAKLQEE